MAIHLPALSSPSHQLVMKWCVGDCGVVVVSTGEAAPRAGAFAQRDLVAKIVVYVVAAGKEQHVMSAQLIGAGIIVMSAQRVLAAKIVNAKGIGSG